MPSQSTLRLIPTPGPGIGHYLSVGRSDHRRVLEVIAEGRLSVSGLVIDATLVRRHTQLLQEADVAGIPRILNPRSFDMTSEQGLARAGMADLPWAVGVPHTPQGFSHREIGAYTKRVAQFAVDLGFDGVLAPTHYLDDIPSPWLDVDRRLTQALRQDLDALRADEVAIYYPLGLSAALLRDPAKRAALVARLRGLDIVDAIWLRVHPFAASTVGPIVLRGYVEACRELHSLGLPLVAEHTGSAGLALAAFGAVGGFESGITRSERFDANDARRLATDAWSLPPRVLLDEIEMYLRRQQLNELSTKRHSRALLACRDVTCCPRGFDDMLRNPIRHFLLQRQRRVSDLAAVPDHLRAKYYVEERLRPAVDRALEASRIDTIFTRQHERLDARRRALEALLPVTTSASRGAAATGGRINRRRFRPHSI